MIGKIMKDFLENRMYKKICDSVNNQETSVKEVVNMIVFFRIDKSLAKKFIKLMEKEKLLKIEKKGKILLNKGFDKPSFLSKDEISKTKPLKE